MSNPALPGAPDDPKQWIRDEADKLVVAGAKKVPTDVATALLPLLRVNHAVLLWKYTAVQVLGDYWRAPASKDRAASLGDGRSEYMQPGLFTEAQLLASMRREINSGKSRIANATEMAEQWLMAHPADLRTVSQLVALASR